MGLVIYPFMSLKCPDVFYFNHSCKLTYVSDFCADNIVDCESISIEETHFSLYVPAEVSVSFDRDSSVTYTFQEPFSVIQNRSSQASRAFTESRAREDMAFSFVTSQRPAMLLTVSTFSQQYITTILARNGKYGYKWTNTLLIYLKVIYYAENKKLKC